MTNQIEGNVGEIYNPEKIKQFPGVSDQQLQYYTNHNIWSQDRIKWMTRWVKANESELPALLGQDELQQIRMGQGRTYLTIPHPLFKGVEAQTDEERKQTTRNIDFPVSLDEVSEYLTEKHNTSSVEKIEDLSREGLTPYGHGSAMFKATGIDINFDVMDENVSNQSPTVLFLKFPAYFIGSAGSGGVMGKIDQRKLSFPEFESSWTTSIESYMKIVPRLVSLLARDPKWDIRDMDAYIQAKGIHNLNSAINIIGNDDTINEMQELMNVIRTREYTLEERQTLNEFIKTWSDVYIAMLEYLESKVTYN